MGVEFQVKDPAFEQRVRESFGQQTFLATLQAKITRLEAGFVEVTAPFHDSFAQQDGFYHAGASTTLMDTACGYAAYTLMPAESRVLSVGFDVSLLSPGVGEEFVARAQVLKPGRTLTICRGELFAVREGQTKLTAAMQATMMCLRSE